ncbi:MAG: hypothetical protein GY711_34945 [bacterium]|nr:hypothetical protein [bacterium]
MKEEDDDPFLTTRVDADGDLARLLDGTNPYDFDRSGDGRLDRREVSRAMFGALDLDGSERLTLAELSRHPGALCQLRYGDLSALEQFGRRDMNKGGTVSPREFKIADREFEVLGADQDGLVQLAARVEEWRMRRGDVGPLAEWPTRQPTLALLSPIVTVDRVFEALDKNGDRKFTKRELKKRSDLFVQLDRNGDDVVREDEVAY